MSGQTAISFTRFLGIIFVGVAALFLAVIAGPFNWDNALRYFMQYAGGVVAIYLFFLILGAFFLSLEIQQDDKSKPRQANE